MNQSSQLQQQEEEESRRLAQRLAEDEKFASEYKETPQKKDAKGCCSSYSMAEEKGGHSDSEQDEDEEEKEDAKADEKDSSSSSSASSAPLSFRNSAEAKLSIRAKYQAKKRLQYASIYHNHPKKHDEKYLSDLWEQANAEVDDVAGAICLSLVLPNIAKLQVKTDMKESLVRIDARRWFPEATPSTKYNDNTQYIAEFVLSGQNIEITNERVYHDYSPETGILFIYVEDICLDIDKQAKEEAGTTNTTHAGRGMMTNNQSNNSNNSNGNNNPQRVAAKQNIMNKMKDNLLRIFSSSHK